MPTAPPNCTAMLSSSARRSPLPAVESPCAHPAATAPKVVGNACCSRVRPAMGVSRCSAARERRHAAAWSRSARTTSPARRERSIAAVSMTSWLVAPWCTWRAASASTVRTRSVSSLTSGITGLPPPAAASPSAPVSYSSGSHAPATASACAGAIRPVSARERANAASVSSSARSQAVSSVHGPTGPRVRTPSNRPVMWLPRWTGAAVGGARADCQMSKKTVSPSPCRRMSKR